MYRINEIFYSVQGEGKRAGSANVFVRFSGCNMECAQEAGERSPGGFDCDTEFVSGVSMTLAQIRDTARSLSAKCNWIVLTGGEPGLQVDKELCDGLHDAGYKLAIETNGSICLPHEMQELDLPPVRLESFYLDWITVSPKVAEHAVRQEWAHEVKYVRGNGQGIPKPTCKGVHKLISPVFSGMLLDMESFRWCNKLVLDNPEWELSVQQHKGWKVR